MSSHITYCGIPVVGPMGASSCPWITALVCLVQTSVEMTLGETGTCFVLAASIPVLLVSPAALPSTFKPT